MIAHGLAAQVELCRDLIGRAAALEQLQNLGLAGGEGQLRVPLGFFQHVGDLTEDADHAAATPQWDGAHLDADATPVAVDEHHCRVRDRRGSEQVARERPRARAASPPAQRQM